LASAPEPSREQTYRSPACCRLEGQPEEDAACAPEQSAVVAAASAAASAATAGRGMGAGVPEASDGSCTAVWSGGYKAAVHAISPPVRLRMTSADKLCARAMLVEWEDGSTERQRWLSSEDRLQNGWYEAEKLLSPTATNITVQFRVKGPRKFWEVCAVDRRNGCSWVLLGKDRYAKEVVCLRVGAGHFSDPIDATFELKGPMHRCFLHRAWNAARTGPSEDSEDWECWEDLDSRPQCDTVPATLVAASAAVPPQEFTESAAYLEACAQRLATALPELLAVHRETLRALRGLDASCTGQWLRANAGTTLSAGLMIAAVPSTILMPPLGIGLAIAGSVASSAAFGGDALQERWSLARLREQLSRDGWNAFVVADLLRAWLLAARDVQEQGVLEDRLEAETRSSEQKHKSSGAMGALKCAAWGATSFSDEAAAALPVLGPIGVIVGAVLSTGIAIHGWTSQRFSQKQVRAKLTELQNKLIVYHFLLARLGRLTCAVCSQSVSEEDAVCRCAAQTHVFHSRCLEPFSKSCPVCSGELHEHSGSCTIVTWMEGLAESPAPATSEALFAGAGFAAPASTSHGAGKVGGADLDGIFWQLVERIHCAEREVDALQVSTEAFSEERLMSLDGEVQSCKLTFAQLQAACDAGGAGAMELTVGLAEVHERLQILLSRHQALRPELQVEMPVDGEEESPVPVEEQPMLSFEPPPRSASGSSGGLFQSAFQEARQRASAAAGRASAAAGSVSHAAGAISRAGGSAAGSVSQKAAAEAAELRARAAGLKDRAASLRASFAK